MGASIIDGKALAAKVKAQTAEAAKSLYRRPGLAVILVGNDPASRVYVTGKEKDCAECGFQSFEHALPEETAQAELLALIEQLNQDPRVDGILCQLPLPSHLDEDAVLNAIARDITLRRGCSLSRSLDGVRECGPDGLRQMGGVQLFPAAPLRKAVDRLFVRRQPGDDGQRHRPFPLQLPDQNAIHTRTVWSEAADAHRRIPVAGHAACPPGAEKRIEVTAVNLCHADNHVEPGLRFSPLILLQCPCGNSQAFRSLFLGKSRQSPLSPKGALFLNVSFFFDIFA